VTRAGTITITPHLNLPQGYALKFWNLAHMLNKAQGSTDDVTFVFVNFVWIINPNEKRT